MTYSTVTEYSGCGVVGYPNSLLCFDMNLTSQNLRIPNYSNYQHFLYKTITEQREKGKTFDQIAEWLNKNGYLSVRGKKFRGAHVHSIVKKKRLKDEKFEKEYPDVRSDFYLDIFDKRLICL